MSEDLVKQLTIAHDELRELFRSLEQNADTIIAKLKDLESVAITADSLRQSGLNKILNELRKCGNASVATSSKNVVEAYKTTLRGGSASGTATTSTNLTLSVPTKRKVDDETETHSAKRPLLSPDPPTPVAEIFHLGMTGVDGRNRAQQLIFNALGTDESGSDGFRTELAVKIEEGLNTHFTKEGGYNSSEYKSRLRLILGNLKDPKNPDINTRLYSGEVMPEEMATMSEFDMASDELKNKRNADLRDSMEARKTDLNVGSKGTDLFQCPKCKKRKCTFTQRQTRSADEPMTIFLRCLECNHRWRQY